MPAELIGGRPGERLEYMEIGRSGAYGTSHFTTSTVDALMKLVQQSSNGQRVNNIFGEGVSPKLRKLRDGLEQLNFPADALLQHGRARIVYGVPLARNLREYLLGMDEAPDYISALDDPREGTEAISAWWMERWFSPRIESDTVQRIRIDRAKPRSDPFVGRARAGERGSPPANIFPGLTP
jgi:hypothetical protein